MAAAAGPSVGVGSSTPAARRRQKG